MGCGNSKNKISMAATPREPTTKPPTKNSASKRSNRRPNSKTITVKAKAKQDTNSDLEGDNIELPPHGKSGKKHRRDKQRDRAWGSQDSLDSSASQEDGTRGWSATSKFSSHSGDSGLGCGDGAGAGGDMEHVITEDSHPDTIKEVEETFNSPRGLELGITGNACPQRFSAKDKDRLEEQRVIASLREEGLIQRPMSRAANGLSFEIVAKEPGAADYMFGPDDDSQQRRPARLEKLEKRRKKKGKVPLTQEQIEAKLERAEQRRKEAEQQRLSKIASLNKSDVLTALDSFANSQKEKVEEVETKMDQATENRENRLKELRDKLKAKQEHAEKVRRRKKLAKPLGEQERQGTPTIPRITEDTPVGGGISTSITADHFRSSQQFDDLPVGISGVES